MEAIATFVSDGKTERALFRLAALDSHSAKIGACSGMVNYGRNASKPTMRNREHI